MKVLKNRALAILMTVCMMLTLLPISALAAENAYDLSIDLYGTGVTWYAADKAGTEIGDGSYAVPATEIEVNEDGDVPTITVTTTFYVKADPGYIIDDLDEFDIEADGDPAEEEDTTLTVEISREGLDYCDLKVTLKFDGYALEGKSASVSLTIDAKPVFDLSIDVGGTGVTWYAEDKAGTEIGDGSYAVPATEIVVNEDGDVPAITVTTTLYVKADPGYAISELDEFKIGAAGDPAEEEDAALGVEITHEGLDYCDLKVTLKFDGYVVEGKSASISLNIDAEPTYLTITVGGTSLDILDINNFSTLSYADAEAIPCAVAYNAAGTTVAVAANVADAKDGVMVGLVVDGEPVFDEESHTGVSAFVDVTPENTIDNPVYVAVKYIPNKEGVTEAKPYDEFFKIALYMTSNSFTDVSPSDYFKDAVAWAVEKGVTMGTGDGTTFSPDVNCTRAQFATFLYRAAGSPAVTGTENPFSDVSQAGNASYYDAILWAVEQGITTGTGDGATFSPDDTITRAQAVTFMYRYAQKKGIATETGAANFGDVANEGALAPYYDAIGWAVANGITNGTGDGTTFSPMGDCDRGMMITFLHRLFTDATA